MRRRPPVVVVVVMMMMVILAVAAVAADVGCTNITISSASHGRHIASRCRTIYGDMMLHPDLAETVLLNGIEAVTGDISYTGRCEFLDHTDSPTAATEEACRNVPEPFSLSSTSLRSVGGAVSLKAWLGLTSISLPQLRRVRGVFALESLQNLTRLDVGSLSHVGGLELEAPLLQKLTHSGLDGFTTSEADLTVWAADLESLDSLLSPRSVYAAAAGADHGNRNKDRGNGNKDDNDSSNDKPNSDQNQEWPLFDSPRSVTLHTEEMPRLRALTIGWPRLSTLSINPSFVNETLLHEGLAPRVTLGADGGDSTNMTVARLVVKGVHSLELHPSLTGGLAGGSVFQLAWTNIDGHFRVPFDNLTVLDVFANDDLQSIELPSSEGLVRNLDELQLSGKGLTVNSLVWPRDNMSTVKLTGKIQSAAFLAFLADRNPDHVNSTTRPLVQDFAVTGHAGSNFSCEPFDRLKRQNVITGEYRCSIQSDATAVSATFSTAAALALSLSLVLRLC